MKLSPDWLEWPQTKILIKAFTESGKENEMRFVGGAIRNSLLKLKVEDVDVATKLTPQKVTELLEKSNIRAIPTGIKHGTVTALIDGKNFEITTLRSDISCDGRHAKVSWSSDWQEDARRRDFTMNALYLSAGGELFDYFCGTEDIEKGIVRFIGNPKERIAEDYLRILRFFRFFAYYGKGTINEEGLAACTSLAEGINNLSGERLQQEMLKILESVKAKETLEIMNKSGVLKYSLGFSIKTLPPSLNNLEPASLRLAALLLVADASPPQALKILAKSWRLSNSLTKYLSSIISHIDDMSGNSDIASQKKIMRAVGVEIFSAIVTLKQTLEPQENYRKMLNLAKNWQIPSMPVGGDDLIKTGIPEGKELGKTLKRLEKLWEGSDYMLTKQDLLKML